MLQNLKVSDSDRNINRNILDVLIRLATGQGCIFEGRAKMPREGNARRGRGETERGGNSGGKKGRQGKIKDEKDSVGPRRDRSDRARAARLKGVLGGLSLGRERLNNVAIISHSSQIADG